ncbi:outer membrane protein assembly factor BamB family protein [Streptomyces sp. NPDC055287]
MEALRQDDPRRIGPYALLLRLRETASAVQYVAHAPDGATAVVAVARPELAGLPAFRRRFQAEAQTAERLAGGWVQAPLDSRADAAEPWTATAYVPALTLAEAVALAGPLPERAVRVLGAALAETLSRVHATGAVLHGLAAETVLLASDGPRLTAFGALGAAAAAEAGPGGQLSVRLGYLTPEQLAGQEPGPASDIFVLGLLLAYAATGATPWAAGPQDGAADRIAHAEPELAAVPGELRTLIARCLAKSPADRPAPGALAAELALEGAAALARPGWLPHPVTTALATQASQASWARAEQPAEPLLPPNPAPTPGPPGPAAGIGAGAGAPAEAGRVAGGARNGRALEPTGLQDSAMPGSGRDAGADVSGGLTRRLVARRGADAPTEDLSGVTRRLVARRDAGTLPGAPDAGQPAGAARSTGGVGGGVLVPAPPLSHPVGALTLPPATVGPHAPGSAPAQLPGPAPMPSTAPAPAARTRTPGGLADRIGGISRRGLLAGIAAGAAGLVVGGGGVLALSDGEDDAPPPRADDPKPAARRKPLPGVAPDPLWHYQHPVALAAGGPPARLWREQVLLVPGEELTTGLDLRTGRPLWEQKAAGTKYGPEAADGTHCFVVTATDFVWLAAKDGQVEHRTPYTPILTRGQNNTRATLGGRVTADGPVVWFSGRVETLGGKKNKVTRTRTYLLAYDMAARKELWRTEMPNGRPGPVPRYEAVGLRPGSLLVRQDTDSLTADQKKKAKGKSAFILVDRRTGKTLWRKFFPGVRPDAGTTDDPAGRLYAAVDGGLQAYDTRNGKRLWRAKDTSGPADDAPFGFGRGVLGGRTLYVPSGDNDVYAVDTASGARQWKRATEYPGRATPRISLSGSGRTVLALNDTQATAIDARDGRRLWKFQDSGVTAPGAEDAWASYRAQTLAGKAVLWRGRNFYGLPLA